jgi:hypothetical protein
MGARKELRNLSECGWVIRHMNSKDAGQNVNRSELLPMHFPLISRTLSRIPGGSPAGLFLAFTFSAALLSGAPAPAASRPNIILLLTDDQGYGDLSVHGNPVLKTPHLDRLHAESVRFRDFHVAPMCTPTRGQLMTGVDALRNGARKSLAAHAVRLARCLL